MSNIKHMRIIRENIVGNLGPSRHATRIAALGTAAAIAFTAFGATAAQADEQHKVTSGDTVSDLAQRYGSTIDAIIAANRLNTRATIFKGSTITIPTASAGTKAPTATNSAKSSTSTSASPATHKVVRGDTVWDLSLKYGTTVSAVVAANGLNQSAIIRIGQQLTMPGAASTSTTSIQTNSSTSAPTASSTTGIHQVAAGDTVWDLSRKYGTTVSAIITANSLTQAAYIRVGQNLSIPGANSTGATTVSNVKQGSTNTSGEPKLATDKNLSEFADTPEGLVGDTFLGRTYSAPVVGAANQNKATLKAMDVPSKTQMQALIIKTANSMGVDPALAQAVAYQESGFDMRAVSPANAIGVMQVIPTSGEWASTIVGRDLNLLIPEDNVVAGVAILKKLQRNGTPLDDAIGGYYQGETAVRKYGLYADTKRYVASVQSLITRFK
ncbi:LysM peptidoglycan-binding domain-containing protein [Demequina aurantiaca]|uniref:lytic transglycosylase domain-containing protein n=1 Tax=Demequina aurantiaca TaxID=676200 RepID=UPI003D333B02